LKTRDANEPAAARAPATPVSWLDDFISLSLVLDVFVWLICFRGCFAVCIVVVVVVFCADYYCCCLPTVMLLRDL
jgi:hypothetical protein